MRTTLLQICTNCFCKREVQIRCRKKRIHKSSLSWPLTGRMALKVLNQKLVVRGI